jgi:hypothetical protein
LSFNSAYWCKKTNKRTNKQKLKHGSTGFVYVSRCSNATVLQFLSYIVACLPSIDKQNIEQKLLMSGIVPPKRFAKSKSFVSKTQYNTNKVADCVG